MRNLIFIFIVQVYLEILTDIIITSTKYYLYTYTRFYKIHIFLITNLYINISKKSEVKRLFLELLGLK